MQRKRAIAIAAERNRADTGRVALVAALLLVLPALLLLLISP